MERLLDTDFQIGQNTEGLFMKKFQEIPTDFLDRNKDRKFESGNTRAGEYHQVASIPTIIVEKWLKEGFDVYREPIKKIVARLRAESLDDFITTKKRI
jgi:hypothetical protein